MGRDGNRGTTRRQLQSAADAVYFDGRERGSSVFISRVQRRLLGRKEREKGCLILKKSFISNVLNEISIVYY